MGSLRKTIFMVMLAAIVHTANTLHAQTINKADKDSIETLLHKGEYSCNKGHFAEAEKLLENAMNYYDSVYTIKSGNKELDSLGFQIRIIYGWSKTLLEKYSEAEPIYKSVEEQLPDTFYVLKAENHVRTSSLYGMQKMYDKAELHAKLALEAGKQAKDLLTIYRAHAFLCDTYMYTKKYEKALAECYELMHLSITLGGYKAMSTGKMGMIYHKLGQRKLAEQYYLESLDISRGKEPVTYSIILAEYCKFLIEQEQPIKARKLAQQLINSNEGVALSSSETELLKIISDTSTAHTIYIVKIILLSLLAAAVLWGIIRLVIRLRKRKTAISISPAVADEPGNTNVSNIQEVQYIGMLETLPQIIQSVQDMKRTAGDHEQQLTEIKKLEQILAPLNSAKIEKDFSAFVEQSDGLARKLKDIYPDLTPSETRLCMLIRQGLNTKEIATLTNKTVRGVESARFRLRKKMSIDTQKEIYDFLLEIEKS